MALSFQSTILILAVAILLFSSNAYAFGAGNIASISAVEGKNWRHGDIEDVLKTVACIQGHKWTSMMMKRVYFGNWLRDYSQAMDTGALKKAQPETIKILVWLLSFLSFGYATAEFEVTSERLGVYRPEEHIDNPKDYNDNEDATKFDRRLRGLVRPIELEIDPETGMKNYIANGKGDWATSAAFVKYSFERSIHFGRLYTNGHGFFKGKDEDLAEALRLLGQGLHTLEDFGAHTNYVELSLRELGFNNVFPHTGVATEINLKGKRVFPLVTGTFGMVDFYHSVLGEATDHFTQSEVNEMDDALGTAEAVAHSSSPITTLIKLLSKVPGTRDLCVEAEVLQRSSAAQAMLNRQAGLGGQSSTGQNFGNDRATQPDWSIPQAVHPQNDSSGQQQNWNQQSSQPLHTEQTAQPSQPSWNASPNWEQEVSQYNSQQHPQSFNMQQNTPQHDPQSQKLQQVTGTDFPQQPVPNIDVTPQATPAQPQEMIQSAPSGLPGLPDFDPAKTIQQIYPILAFRDKVVRSISAVIEKIPGLEALVDRITETLTVFVLSLLAPFVRPVIKGISASLQMGSGGVVESSGQHQYEPWTDPHCTNPTHSLLSKDHFSNILNEPAGHVASEILKFIAPRVLYAWQHTDVPIEQVNRDIEAVFHHPAIREERLHDVHRTMFEAVRKWVNGRPDRGSNLNDILSSDGVRNGKNQKASNDHTGHNHQHGPSFHTGLPGLGSGFGGFHQQHQPQHGGGGIGGFASQFLGSGGQQQQHGQQGPGMQQYINMASKLPIPGVQNLANKYNKFSHFIPGGRSRAVDENSEVMTNRGFDVDSEIATVGGRDEMREAGLRAQRYGEGGGGRSPSPMPMPPPSGYEVYGGAQGGAGQGEYRPEQQQQQQQYGQDEGQGQGYGYGGQEGGGYYRG